jgi:phage/plasmid-like protein (TIGR03299 family)
MSRESSQWLNTMTLIGFTSKRGNAWHYREDDQGNEPNHYPDAIPMDDVLRRLFNFEVWETPLYVLSDQGYAEVPGRKAMVTSDSGDVLGIFKSGYQGHQYQEWLLSNVATIIDADLGIGSAGLLRNRAQAWVSVEVPDSITTPEGVEFRPNLTACTSFDGSLATTYKRHVGIVVCDNTLSGALSEDGQSFKVKHSKYSGMKITDARDALAIVHSMADEFAAEVAKLCTWKVSEKAFDRMLNLVIPLPEDAGRAMTIAENKRNEILHLYREDDRSAPWNGTAFGVLQAFNTWNHHFATVKKGVPRILRNMENIVTDKMANADVAILENLAVACK